MLEIGSEVKTPQGKGIITKIIIQMHIIKNNIGIEIISMVSTLANVVIIFITCLNCLVAFL